MPGARTRRRVAIAAAGVGLLLAGGLVLVVDGGAPQVTGWDADEPSDDPSDLTVDLRAARDGPSARPPAEPGTQAPRGDPLTCVVADCIAWRTELSTVADPQVVLVEAGRIVVLQPLAGVPDRGAERSTDESGGGHLGILAVIDATTGTERWQTRIQLPTTDIGAVGVAVVGEQLLVTEEPGMLRSFGLDDGAPGWSTALDPGAVVDQARRIGSDLLVVLAPVGPGARDAGSRVVAVGPDTGVVRWTSETAQRVVLTSVGPVLFDAFDRMRGLDPGDGDERWSSGLRTLPEQILVLDGLLVLDRSEASVIDARDGTWLTTLPGVLFPAADDDGLLVASLVAVSHLAPDGSTWTSTMLGCCRASSLDAESVTVLTERGEVRRFARDDGRELDGAPTDATARRDGEAVALLGGYLFAIEGNQRARVFVVEEARGGRQLARFGAGYPLDVTDEGALLFTEPGRAPGEPVQLVALRPPEAPTGIDEAAPGA